MAIRPPSWCVGAVPELNKGWVDPNSGELLVSSRFSQAQIDEFYGIPSIAEVEEVAPPPPPPPQPEPDPEVILHDMITEGKIQAAMAEHEENDEESTEEI